MDSIAAPPILMRPKHRSETALKEGRKVFPDGTSRVTIERDGGVIYAKRGEGAFLVDVDGNRFLDLNNNFTTLIHGHAYPPVVAAVSKLLMDGSCFANPTEHEIELAALLVERIPAIEHVRFVNSGTEAVMFAIKAARALTGKPGLVRFEGSYHGSYDWAEVGQSNNPNNWGPEQRPAAVSSFSGTPDDVGRKVTVLPFNDVDALEQGLSAVAHETACILIDVMPSRAGLIEPASAFITALMELARRHSILIISDEVLNLRQGYHGASERFGLIPDLITAGKIIGGGFPIGAIGGSKEMMSVFSAEHGRPGVPQGGTFSANPVSMVAGLTTMTALTKDAFIRLEDLGEQMRKGLRNVIAKHGAPFCVTGSASLFRIHPRPTPPRNYRDAYTTNAQADTMRRLGRHAAAHGILLPSGASACLSTAMGPSDIEHLIDVFDAFLSQSF
ncbi:aspartate aminotransferase family protein [Ensifer sp. NM-2]|uniref:aspartate aminotransferase family protein n=1 Tax=Ensifer sp. NM-2 TaxID=2109730 RepID=UPI000D11EFC7|nr:aspartate aminotransferase family protein [Ensifer sp. NM-2]